MCTIQKEMRKAKSVRESGLWCICNRDLSASHSVVGHPKLRGSFKVISNWGKGAEPLYSPYIEQLSEAEYLKEEYNLNKATPLS